MDDRLREQLEKILAKADAKDLKRTEDFFRQVQSIELPPEADRAWISEQMQIYLEAHTLAQGEQEAARLWPITLFTMGRAYERYYAPKKRL
ncbi:unnamed protein product [marine sediment metagenome]|uniref:Uncharacterized protein n=1 Tax=marine sediment metagenome TaxID=412755 RepID=X1S084_9ZZZZ